ncbi:MAG: hypothetical protein KAI66_16045, partial [Lentisphaeria bacterium]|nr:hypothetical protein [Lentisphaeria bacterium]
ANVFRGKLDRPIPGWAYDEQGRYINTGIGHRLLIEYLRSLRNNDFQLGVIGNSGDPFMVATVLDSHLTEAKDQPNLEYRKFLPQRLMWGGKPIHLHSGGGFDNPALEIDWSTLSDDEIRLFYQDHLHRWMLGCWQGGYVPSVMHIPGRESVVREMPAVLDVMSRGYRCVPACSGDTRLVRARYGKGLRSVLVVSNPTQAKIATTEFVHDAYIADGHVVPVQYDGGALTFEQRPDGTRVPLVVGRNRTALITVPMALEWLGDAADFACTGETSADIAIDRIVVTAALTTNLTRQCRISAEAPPNYRCVGITLADREVVGSVCTIPAGTATLTVEFRSELFQTPEVDLMDFPFASASIVLPAQAPARIQGASAMLNDAIVAHFGAELGLVERLPEAGAVIRIGMSPSPGIALSRDGRILSVSGATPFATQQAVAKLIRWILDRKLRYIPPFFYLPIQPTRDMLSRIGVGRDSFFVDVATSGGKIPKRLTGRALSGGGMVQPRQAERLVGHRIAGGYYADDSVLVWAFEGDGFASWKNLSVYVNADDRGSGRETVADGCDWRLSMDRATGRGQLHRYDDIAPDADGATIVRGTHRRQLAMIEATVAQTDKCLYVAVRRDLMKRLPPIPAIRFYLLLYLEDGSNRRVTFRARPDGDAMGDAVDLGTLQARKNAEEIRAELAVPTLAGKPVIDGRLDEPFWDRAARIHRLGPLRGDHVNEPTEAFLAFTDNAFVLGVRCWDSRLKYVGRSAVARDSQRIWASHDHVEVFLAPGVSAEADSYPFYQLMSNVAGSQWDGYKLSDAWNGSWQVKTSSSESCWEAEFRIPLSDLGEHAQASVWRFNVARFLSLRREWSTWAPITGGLQKPNGFGVLVRQDRK